MTYVGKERLLVETGAWLVGRLSTTIQRPRAIVAQWRPMKATLFDALILTPGSGAKLPFVAQVLRAKLGNLILHAQIHKGPNSRNQKRIDKRVQNWALARGEVTHPTVRLSTLEASHDLSEQLSIITRKRPFNESHRTLKSGFAGQANM